jgi:hypothetical protein
MPAETSTPIRYDLHETRQLCLRIHYPADLDQLVLRTDLDWDKDILPSSIAREGSFAEFNFETTHPFVYLKPCLRRPSGLLWATGPNGLVVATRDHVRDIYPTFHSSAEGTILDVITLESNRMNRQHSLRVYLPAGYDENTCRSLPVMYMQDGSNLFFRRKRSWGKTGGFRKNWLY